MHDKALVWTIATMLAVAALVPAALGLGAVNGPEIDLLPGTAGGAPADDGPAGPTQVTEATRIADPASDREGGDAEDDGFPYANAPGTPVGQAVAYLKSEQAGDGAVGSFGVSAWAAVAAVHAGEDPDDWRACATCPSLEAYLVTAGADRAADGVTFRAGENATDWARQLLALSLAGVDVRDAGGSAVDYVAGLMSTFDGTQFGHPDLMYDDYFAVLALHATGLDAADPDVRLAVDATEDWIVANQFPDGGWSWRSLASTDPFSVAFGPTGDVDSTATAIQALVAAGTPADDLPIRRGFTFVKTHQYVDGGCGSSVLFDSVFNAPLESNTASTSWTVDALSAAGDDPTSQAWTTPTGNDLVDFLLSMQRDDGSFGWAPSNPGGFTDDSDVLMTAYAVTALTGASYVGPATAG